MAIHDTFDTDESTIPAALRRFLKNRLFELAAMVLTATIAILALSLASWSPADPSFNHATGAKPGNWLGSYGAIVSDQLIQFMGLGVLVFLFVPLAWSARLFQHERVEEPRRAGLFWIVATLAFTCLMATLPAPASWPLAAGLGGHW